MQKQVRVAGAGCRCLRQNAAVHAPTVGELIADATARASEGVSEKIAKEFGLGISWAANDGGGYARERQTRRASVLCVVGDGRDEGGLSVPDVVNAHGVLCVCHFRSAYVLRAHSGH